MLRDGDLPRSGGEPGSPDPNGARDSPEKWDPGPGYLD